MSMKHSKKFLNPQAFKVRLLEYFDGKGLFYRQDWSPEQGTIHRSERFDERNMDGRLAYTSIIIDALKED